MAPIIQLENVDKTYKQGTDTIKAVDNTSLEIQEGEFVVIIGPSGSGKSTLLQLIGGLDRPTSGKIHLDGTPIHRIGQNKITAVRRKKIGFIFQGFNLIPTLTALQNVEAAIGKHSRKDREKAAAALELVGLGHRLHHVPSLMSGGEQQRVAIARALINDPKVILADEPTGNLDSKTGEEIIKQLRALSDTEGKTVVLITHGDNLKKFAHRIIEIRDGVLKE